MNRDQFLANRRTGIGGSDVAPILGLSPWKTPLDVYLEKRGEGGEQPDNEAMLWGRALEPAIRQEYANRTGRVVHIPDGVVRHPKLSWMIANLDGATSDGRVFEAKTARSGTGWGEPGTDEVPQSYLLQVQHYMAVTGYLVADIAVLIGGSDFRVYEVPADPELHAMLVDAESEFWQRVQDGNPPDPVTLADALQRFGRSNAAGAVTADNDLSAAVAALHHTRAQMNRLEEEADADKARILAALGDKGDTLVDSQGRILATWKLAKAPARFDTKAFAASHPDLHKQFTIGGTPSRRLLLKD